MLKKLLILAFALLFCSPAWAMRTPMFGGSSTNLSASATRYEGFASAPVATNDSTVKSLSPMSGTVEGLYVYLPVAPDNGGGTQSYAFTFQKNGSDTSITCTISESSTTCSDITHSVSLVATDTFSVKIVPSGTPTVTYSKFSTIFNSGSGGGAILYSSSAGTNGPSASVTSTASFIGNVGWRQSSQSSYFPTGGTLSNFYVLTQTAPGSAASGKQIVYTVQKNSVDTAVTCTMLETATSCSDTTHSFAIVATDSIRVVSTPTNTPSTGDTPIAAVFTPTIDGESVYFGGYGGGSPSASVDNFNQFGYWGGFSTTEATQQMVVPSSSIVAKKLYFNGSVNPGAAKSFVHDLRVNGASSSLTCTRTGASGATVCADTTNTVSLAAGNLINWRMSPTGTPAVSTNNYEGMVLFIDPTDKIYGATIYDSTLN